VVYADTGFGAPLFPGDDEDSIGLAGSEWQLGAPLNTQGVTAHTGTNVWATNLRGDLVDFAITDLITPAISLTAGSRTALRFWQYYDFSTAIGDEDDPFGDFVLEAGQVAISTNNGATWKDLYSPMDESSVDWEEISIDLSRYAGQVVRFRFNYQLFNFTTSPRIGWMIDDVQVVVSAMPGGDLRVLNNLAQAVFTLQGPDGAILEGSGVTYQTNLPPGEYRITWGSVPFFLAPVPQTNTLSANDPLVFQGVYTYPDANTNRISDLWEEHFFGAVLLSHPPETDSDGDNASDQQEFLAGTDPGDPQSWLQLKGPELQANRTVRFEWTGAAGREYQLEVSNDLGAWHPVGTAQRGTGQTLGILMPALDPQLAYFFRLRVTP
jgi:hypothetical protein